jgi:Caspase domain/Agenet domain
MDWQPETTRIFAVGLLEWEDSEFLSSFPDAVPDRFDEQLVNFFYDRGVPEDQIVFLKDDEATLENIQASFNELLENSNEDDLLIVYFAGHGGWDSETGEHYFYNYDARADDSDTYWVVSAIFDTIEASFNGDKALLMADCCHSGGLIIEAKQRKDSEISYACVSSAYTHNSSTGEWTFTESLYKGLTGDIEVDLDGDREITLYDFSRYAELEMAFIEEQKSMFMTTGDFDPQMLLARVEGENNSEGVRRVEVEWEGDWYKAKVYRDEGDRLNVYYIDDGSFEEDVDRDRVRPYEPEMFEVGEEIEAFSEDEWKPATVKKAWYGLHWVTYDDLPDDYDEWLGSEYVRSRE